MGRTLLVGIAHIEGNNSYDVYCNTDGYQSL